MNLGSIFYHEKFEDTNGEFSSRKSEDRQHNNQKKKNKRTDNAITKRKRTKEQTMQ